MKPQSVNSHGTIRHTTQHQERHAVAAKRAVTLDDVILSERFAPGDELLDPNSRRVDIRLERWKQKQNLPCLKGTRQELRRRKHETYTWPSLNRGAHSPPTG